MNSLNTLNTSRPNRVRDWRYLEVGGGVVERPAPDEFLLRLPPVARGYGDAQLDDYGPHGRAHYPHRPGTTLRLQARFSHPAGELLGTAGFGFWNAPYGDPSVSLPALPQAAWFFYASAPNDLPFAPHGPGRGWFAATIDATTARALAIAPLAPLVLLLNQLPAIRRRLWPAVQQRLAISFAPLPLDMTAWHTYELAWRPHGCFFAVDGRPILQTPHSPRGPLGFVCWVDNQYLVATPTGRLRWGTLLTPHQQWLHVRELEIDARLPAP